jgi:hypothetical protein
MFRGTKNVFALGCGFKTVEMASKILDLPGFPKNQGTKAFNLKSGK